MEVMWPLQDASTAASVVGTSAATQSASAAAADIGSLASTVSSGGGGGSGVSGGVGGGSGNWSEPGEYAIRRVTVSPDPIPHTYPYRPWEAVVIAVVLLSLVVGTVVGNILVCVAVCLVRKLRRPCNYLLVSLAVSDLCVATLVMPMALLGEVLGEWRFGAVLCDVWVSFDVLSCTASILNLCMISVDRYYAITKPLEYGVKRTPRRMIICVSIVWLSAACISVPPLLIMGNEHGDGGHDCIVCQNFWYQIYATLGSFYIPLAVMMTVYYKIFKAAKRIVREEKRAQAHFNKLRAKEAAAASSSAEKVYAVTEIGRNGSAPETKTVHHENNSHHHHYPRKWLDMGPSCGNGHRKDSKCALTSSSGDAESSVQAVVVMQQQQQQQGGGNGKGKSKSPMSKSKLRFVLAKERKASTTLGIIMSAFTVCWLPFFVLALVRPFISNPEAIPHSLSSLFLWLGYANSLLNPIIYATLNKDFRKPFREILCFRCNSLNVMMREEFYHSQYGEPDTSLQPGTAGATPGAAPGVAAAAAATGQLRHRVLDSESQVFASKPPPDVVRAEASEDAPKTSARAAPPDCVRSFTLPLDKLHSDVHSNLRDFPVAMLCGPQRESFL